MSGYGYLYNGSSNYNFRPVTDDWSKASYVTTDHVYGPVLMDEKGKKRPIISYNPSQNTGYYVAKAETVLERLRAPVTAEYKFNSLANAEPPKVYYGSVDEKWHTSMSPVDDDRPAIVNEFLTKVQNEASRQQLMSATYRRQPPTSYQVSPGHNDQSHEVMSNINDWSKSSGNDNYGRWSKPNQAKPWNSPPNSSSLSSPTNDIDKAMEYLKDAAAGSVKPSSGISTNTPPAGGWTKPNPSQTDSYSHSRPVNDTNKPTESLKDAATSAKPSSVISTNTPPASGWAKPDQATTWTSPTDSSSSLSKPANDINKPMEYLKDAATSAKPSGISSNTPPASGWAKPNQATTWTSPTDSSSSLSKPANDINKPMECLKDAATSAKPSGISSNTPPASGWAKPNQATTWTSPTDSSSSLSKPANDINKPMEYLKDAATSAKPSGISANTPPASGWAKPNQATTWTSPTDSSSFLSKPTNDINNAMEYLKDAAASAKPYSGISANTPPGGWAKPNHGTTWASPTDSSSSLGKPTNDIDKAMDYIKDAASGKLPSSGIATSRPATKLPFSSSTGATTPKRNSYVETIDSNEAAKKHGKFKISPWTNNDKNRSIIDSREAAKKYGGRIL